MNRAKATPKRPPQQYDYALALQKAVSWLGDRYLLAQPVTRPVTAPRAYFNEPRHWHRAGGPR